MTPIVFITKLDGGGMEAFCLSLLRGWVAQGTAATLYVSYPGGVREMEIPAGVENVCWGVRARRSFFRIARWLRKRPDDPCLALSQELAVVLLLLKRLHLIKNRIYYRESTDVEKHYGKHFKRLMRWLWPKLDGIVEQSRTGAEATRRICSGRLPSCRIVRNIQGTVADQDVTFPMPGAVVRLACVGSFKPMKGQRYLVDELSRDESRDWTLTFWGDGEKRGEVKALVESRGLAGKIKFNEWDPDRKRIYDNCDIVVIPSDYEGLPNVMLEAILHGRRVSVRPTCAGACELLDEIGLSETWPWCRSLEVPVESWAMARERLVVICSPEKASEELLSFMAK